MSLYYCSLNGIKTLPLPSSTGLDGGLYDAMMCVLRMMYLICAPMNNNKCTHLLISSHSAPNFERVSTVRRNSTSPIGVRHLQGWGGEELGMLCVHRLVCFCCDDVFWILDFYLLKSCRVPALSRFPYSVKSIRFPHFCFVKPSTMIYMIVSSWGCLNGCYLLCWLKGSTHVDVGVVWWVALMDRAIFCL